MIVAVLGCGPTGLLVAHAVEQAGHVPEIYSRAVKSRIPGSQHLHGPVPGLTSVYPEGVIQFVRMGNARDYALKVYGDPERETGWGNYLQVYPSWNIVSAYDRLWETYSSSVIDMDLIGPDVHDIISTYPLVISTLPQPQLCEGAHRFDSTNYFIQQLPTPPADVQNELVVYNGLLQDEWYRWSILGGLCSIEYVRCPANMSGVTAGNKAIGNNCDCFKGMHRCGRWAEWRHGVTMYKAYQKAATILEGAA